MVDLQSGGLNVKPLAPAGNSLTVTPLGGAGGADDELFRQAINTYQSLVTDAQDKRRKRISKTYSPELAAAKTGASTFVDNLLATPSVLADLVSYPLRDVFDGPPGFSAELNATPRLTNNDIVAGYRSLVGDESFSGALSDIEADNAMIGEEFPLSSGVGAVGGDVLTLMTGKAPFSKALRKKEARRAKEIERVEDAHQYGSRVWVNPSAAEKALLKSPILKKIPRWGGRTLEAGLEGFTLGMLKEQDPVELATWTAGAQGGSSLLNSIATHHLAPRFTGNSKLLNFAVNAGAMSIALTGLGLVLPGEQDVEKDYNARKTAIEKGIVATTVGLATGIVSGRARSGKFSAVAPRAVDALASIPRHTMQVAMERMLAKSPDERAAYTEALSNLETIGSLTDEQLRAWSKAVQSGGNAMVDFMDKNLIGQ